MKFILSILVLMTSLTSLGQTFANTGSGTIGSNSIPSGWTATGSPDYSSRNVNGYNSGTYWTSTLPATPGGDTTFPVLRSTSSLQSIKQTITGLTSGTTYTISVSYMYPTATGTYATRFNKPVMQCAYARFDTGSLQYFTNYGFSSSTNVWYTQTFSVTTTDTTLVLELGITSSAFNRAAAAFNFSTAPAQAYLPVNLISFTGREITDGSVALEWETGHEKNNSHFEIQRSYDGKEYATITSIPGKGSSAEKTSYSYLDQNSGTNHQYIYYQLKQIDFDGSEFTSQKIGVETSSKDIAIRVQDGMLYVKGNLPRAGIKVDVLSGTGQVLICQLLDNNTLNISILPKGVYFIRLYGKNSQILKKFVVQ